ncbi:Uncharacterised protein [Mycobacteroides abscessus subsp. abscessus]|nr:Uncharacterised protein [Mycobacteroides abscessus subsp. abscessus]
MISATVGPEVEITGREALRDCPEAVSQNLGVAHLAGRQRVRDALGRGDFRGDPVPTIQCVMVALIGLAEIGVPVDKHSDRVQFPGACLRLGALCGRDQIDQLHIAQLIEHAFDFSEIDGSTACMGPLLWMNSGLWINRGPPMRSGIGRPPRGPRLVCVCVRVESLGGAAAPNLDHLGGPVKVETAADAAGYLDQDIRWMRGQLHAGKL